MAGCSKESKPVAEEPRLAQTATPGDAAGDAAAEAQQIDPRSSAPAAAAQADSGGPLKAQVSEASFELKLAAKNSYAAGKEGRVEVVLEAKAPFKVNQEYPYSFSLNASPGVSFAHMKLNRDRVILEEKRATLSVPFTPTQSGSRTISGTFKFSVCTDEQCLIKKHDLGTSVNVQ
jgi:hypothetical protein